MAYQLLKWVAWQPFGHGGCHGTAVDCQVFNRKDMTSLNACREFFSGLLCSCQMSTSPNHWVVVFPGGRLVSHILSGEAGSCFLAQRGMVSSHVQSMARSDVAVYLCSPGWLGEWRWRASSDPGQRLSSCLQGVEQWGSGGEGHFLARTVRTNISIHLHFVQLGFHPFAITMWHWRWGCRSSGCQALMCLAMQCGFIRRACGASGNDFPHGW